MRNPSQTTARSAGATPLALTLFVTLSLTLLIAAAAVGAELPTVAGVTVESQQKAPMGIRVDYSSGQGVVSWDHPGAATGDTFGKAVSEIYRNVPGYQAPASSFQIYDLDGEWGDILNTTEPGWLEEIEFHFGVSGTLNQAAFQIKVYDTTVWPTYPQGTPESLLVTLNTPALPLNLTDSRLWINLVGLRSAGIQLNTQEILITWQLVSYTGSVNSFGAVFHDVPQIGASEDQCWLRNEDVPPGQYFKFTNFFVNNLAFSVAASPICAAGPEIAIANGFFPFDTLPLGGAAVDSLVFGNLATCEDLTWQIVDAPGGNGPHPWFEISQTSGVLAPGQQVALGLNVDAFELETGQYEASMAIETNDPAQPSVNFLVTMTVYSELGRAQPGVLYATQGYDGSGLLVTIDTATGVATPVGNTRVAGIQGLAISGATSLIQGVGAPVNSDLGRLYTLDGNSGAVIKTGGVPQCFQAMAYCGDELFGVALCGRQRLYTIDPTTGESLSSPGLFPAGMLIVGLACDPTTGILYGAESFSETGAINLHTINTTTGALTLVGPLGLGPDDVIGDIAFDSDGNLFGVTGERITANKLVAINKATGQATVIGLTGIDYLSGLDFGRSVALYRVNVGGAALGALDLGIAWDEDTNTSPSPYRNQGGNPDSYPSGTLDPSVPATTPPEIFHTERWASQMFWDFPVGAGRAVEVRLYFKNGYWGTSLPGQRVFNVEIDGVPVLTNYDIVADVGQNVGVMKSFFVVGDGNLDIDFLAVVDNPLVCAIEIRGEVPGGTPSPVPDGPTPPSARVRLGEAAPNPFNPTTRFSYDLPAGGHVTVRVYDAQGRKVGTIVDGVQSAGTHQVSFSGERLASGVYFYELRAGGVREVRKMTLLK
ncbi:MAG: T9SS type A sorting domain-containing protein [Krumholzibacteria bacterium]|nr:T9SS type A sorting domain-containing protein [Candidatus Krumholzibacteria bacterium]